MTWLDGWRNRIKLVIDGSKIEGDLINFPVLITLSSGSGITNQDVTVVFDDLYLNPSPSYKRIAITTYDQVQCYVEIESWDWTNKQSWLWAKIPTLSSGIDAVLYLYYDNTHVDNIEYVGDPTSSGAINVWDNQFESVLHMNENSSPYVDSKGIGNYTTSNIPTRVTSQVHYGEQFDGVNDYLLSPVSSPNAQITVEMLAKYNSNLGGVTQMVTSKYVNYGGVDTGSHYQWVYSMNGEGKSILTSWPLGSYTTHSGLDVVPQDEWAHIALTFDGSNYSRFYINGDLDASGPQLWTQAPETGSGKNVDEKIGISGYTLSLGSPVYRKGTFDEFRYSDTARSGAWIKATYNSSFDSLITYDTFSGYFEGHVYETSVPVPNRSVRAYRRDDGVLMSSTTSVSGTGYFYLTTTYSGAHYLICLDDESGDVYNLLGYDLVTPIVIS